MRESVTARWLRVLGMLAALALAGCDGAGADSEDAAGGDIAGGETLAETDAPTPRGTLYVVTTRFLRAASRRLDAFVAAREAEGFRVIVATEDDYGAEDLRGPERALAIRAWLRDAVTAPALLLLIGDAHAQYGDVPMFRVWPRHSYPPDDCVGAFAIDCRSMESDVPYANLSGDWDLDGDGRLGEHGDDDGPGGIDFTPELTVGRIPVYFDEVADLDQILEHAIAYGEQTPEEAAYRLRMLLPATFYYFRGQRLATYTCPKTVDGAETPEWFLRNVLGERPDVEVVRLYEREGVVVSAYDSEGPATREAMREAWAEGVGMVWWFGHGLERAVYRTVWTEDRDGDGRAQEDEIASPYLFDVEDALQLPAGRPAFVVAVSCEVGSAETPLNLTHALLLAGAAVGMVASSDVTPGDTTDYGDLTAALDTASFGATNLGAVVFEELLAGRGAAAALAQARTTLGTSASVETYAGKMMLNYFGDPTLGLTPR